MYLCLLSSTSGTRTFGYLQVPLATLVYDILCAVILTQFQCCFKDLWSIRAWIAFEDLGDNRVAVRHVCAEVLPSLENYVCPSVCLKLLNSAFNLSFRQKWEAAQSAGERLLTYQLTVPFHSIRVSRVTPDF
jgi:hypothetical protein